MTNGSPMFQRQTVALPQPAFLTERSIEILRFGTPGARPKAYFQASLHADEVPAMLVAHHLVELLEAAARRGEVLGEVVIVPVANPIGLGQHVNGAMLGRFELGGLGNFNRNYPDLAGPVGDRIGNELTDDAGANVGLIRQAMLEALDGLQPVRELDHLRLALLRNAVDADIALDLHCDDVALMHLYLGTPLWPDARDLAGDLGSVTTLLAEVSGGNPFDEAVGGPWWELAKRFPDRPIPPACLSGTIELRGQGDVEDGLAARDAAALFRFLQRRGVLAGDPGLLSAPPNDATPLAGIERLDAPHAGICVYKAELGDRVQPGELVAELVVPGRGRTPIRSSIAGVLFTRVHARFLRPGQNLAKIAGTEPRRTGNLLSD